MMDLLHGNIDLIIDMLPFKVENVETVPLCDEEILLAVPDNVLEHAYPGPSWKEIKEQLVRPMPILQSSGRTAHFS